MEFKARFKSKEELLRHGKDALLANFLSVIEGVDDKFIIYTSGMDETIYWLGFSSYDVLERALNKQPISALKPFLQILTDNIMNSLNQGSDYISRCFAESRDLELSFDVTDYHFSDNGPSEKTLRFRAMSYQKGTGCGNGHGFTFHLGNSEKRTQLKSQIEAMNFPQSVKKLYCDYLDDGIYGLSIDAIKEWTIDHVVELIDAYIYVNGEKYKHYASLEQQGIKNTLTEFIQNDSFTSKFADAITIAFKEERGSSYDELLGKHKEGELYLDGNTVEIRFLGEIIKTIYKTSYTVYEIS